MKISRKKYFKEFINIAICRYLMNQSNAWKNLIVYSRDPISFQIQTSEYFEINELNLIIDFLKQENLIHGIALDVGANIGNHSLFFDEYFDSVESFEPHPLTFKLLQLNTRLGNDISVHNFGASDFEELLTLYNQSYSFGGASLHPHATHGVLERNQVLLKPLDSLPHLFHRNIGLIKIDVEGHELSVLKGCVNLIKKNKPVILFEQHLPDFDRNGNNRVIDFLRELSYRDFAVIKRSHEGILDGGLIGRISKHLYRLLLGYEIRLEFDEQIPPGTYSVILARP
jgi:FkbM family methyltransferase